MGAVNKNKIKGDLAEWRKEGALLKRLEAKRDAELKPIEEKYERATAPILGKHAKKIDPVNDRIAVLEERITAELRKGISVDTLKAAVTLVTGDGAEAELTPSKVVREVDPRELFDSVTPKQRSSATFWSCFKVLIATAETLLGEGIDAIATAKKNWKVEIRESE